MTYFGENPFANCDDVLGRNHLLGRDAFIQDIEKTVIKNARNLSIYGMFHIGKSCLIHSAIMEKKSELHQKMILPILIDLPAHLESGQESEHFFRILVGRCLEELEELDWTTDPIKNAAIAMLQNGNWWSDSVSRTQRFFKRVREAHIRIIFILDKFDHITTIFGESIRAFQRLQDLSEIPECRVTFITLSWRPLKEIAPHMREISRFDKAFLPRCLSVFDEYDMKMYFERLASVAIDSGDANPTYFPVSSNFKEKIEFYCGRHPYLLTRLGYELAEAFLDTGEVDVDKTVLDMQQVFVDYVIDLKRTLSKYKLLDKLIQMVIGPVLNITIDDEQELLRYGLIKLNEQQIPLAFCNHLQSYLKIVDMDDLNTLWGKTEQTLRKAIASILENAYGSNWFAQLERDYKGKDGNGSDMFERCRKAYNDAVLYGETKPAKNLLDYTQPKDLFDIMLDRSQWHRFRDILGKSWHYWKDCSIVLGRVRNPIAHNRPDQLHEESRHEADRYCREILKVFQAYT